MTFDLFKRLNLTPGQEVVAQDLMDDANFLESKLADQFYSGMGHTMIDGSVAPEFSLEMQSGLYAYALTTTGAAPVQGSANNHVKISAGTLYQKIGSATGSTPSVLSYKFPGTDEVVIANGDPSNPRIDIVQMSLFMMTDDIQSRAFLQSGLKAAISCASFSTHVNSVLQARLTGQQGNNITFTTVADGSGIGNATVSGNTVTFHYQSGTTTVANFESVINGTSQSLLNVKTIGTPGNVFVSPADTISPQLLTGGVNSVIVSSPLSTKNRVACTLAVKQGTPAASPQYPLPDSGFVMIAGVLVGTNYVAAGALLDEDTAGAVAVLHDQRVPISVGVSHVMGNDLMYNTSLWTLTTTRDMIIASSGADSGAGANAVYRQGESGRLLAIASFCDTITTGGIGAGIVANLVKYQLADSGGNLSVTPGVGTSGVGTLITLASCNGLAGGTSGYRRRLQHTTTLIHLPLAGPTVTTNSSGVNPPIWTSGRRCPRDPHSLSTAMEALAFTYQPQNVGGFHGAAFVAGPVTFWIAKGLC